MNNFFLKHIGAILFLLTCQINNLVLAEPINDPVEVFVSILPQKYFVERIAGNYANVEVMVTPGQSPETYDPSPKQLAQLSLADVYFSIGVPFEKVWMSRMRTISNELLIVDSSFETESDHAEHGHEDPHIWTSPVHVNLIADQILEALLKKDPKHESEFRKNHESFKNDLKVLHQEIQTMLRKWAGKGVFLVMHPAWGHFAEAYQLEQIAIEHEGKSPSAKSLQYLINRAKQENIKVVFIQDQHSSRMADTVAAEINAKVVRLDPLAIDYLQNMRKVAEALAESLCEATHQK
ncbi:MAG: metal ABC transporter solute-binding protein, Zn/Mn family [Gammaproteobacteria bacterium]